MRQHILAKPHARRTAGHFLEKQQDRLALFGRKRQGAVMIAQPRDIAKLTMLAKGNSIFLHGANMVSPVRKTMTIAAGSVRIDCCVMSARTRLGYLRTTETTVRHFL
ncbi:MULTISPECIES: hypothetical protein [unclassified Mesorhizobium]|uniref:hypothetical protein n=1 Tax=unclassified Mesorhizobium TaxID=325217 RepID=UPI001FEF326A|nr:MULTISPECIES: hypothetical protein [unclassified Mesorhizobium]